MLYNRLFVISHKRAISFDDDELSFDIALLAPALFEDFGRPTYGYLGTMTSSSLTETNEKLQYDRRQAPSEIFSCIGLLTSRGSNRLDIFGRYD